MTSDHSIGSRIFVPLEGNSKIMLSQGDFGVLDANGTDGTASFQLPNPDPENDGHTEYSVWARALGTPGGSSTTTTCATDIVDGDGTEERYPLFDDELEDYFWNYDNKGLKVAQLRFYEHTTDVT
jgi:hypothetical protein